MDTSINYNINFGQILPTKPLLKSLARVHTYDDAKDLYLSTTSKFVGNVGYYKRAIIIADNAVKKNDNICKISQELSGLSKEDVLVKIDKIADSLGENIDIKL